MGQHFAQQEFSEQDFQRFAKRLEQNLSTLRAVLNQPGWGQGECSVGAELEIYLLNADGSPNPCNEALLAAANDALLTEELNRFNLEYNLPPVQFKGAAFGLVEQQLLSKLSWLRQLAKAHQAHVAAIGILPTLEQHHFGLHSMSDRPRYHVLAESLRRLRGGPFHIDIQGPEQLSLDVDDLTLEGANTSFQFHYRVSPEQFNDTYNAVQLITPIVLAVASNSPYLLGKELWQETRIALFKQSIDPRDLSQHEWRQPPRVGFGQGWLHDGAYQLFAESVQLFPPLLPLLHEDEPDSQSSPNQAPPLHELRVHHGTVWSWNRAIYDPVEGGHLRIELRTLPAGPTAKDMVANAALAIGLTEGLRPVIQNFMTALPFKYASYNFYRAAQHGLEAKLIWPQPEAHELEEISVGELVRHLLPFAREGLLRKGIDEAEANHYLSEILNRVEKRQTGASWQVKMVKQLEQKMSRPEALQGMLQRYMQLSESNLPVAHWSLEQ